MGRSGAGTHATVEGRHTGAPADDLTLRRLADHAFHPEQCVAVWEIRLALLLDRHPRDCRHLPGDCLLGTTPTDDKPSTHEDHDLRLEY